jgi:acetyl-CoA carboxylase biotin carboxyl carrier protein
MLRKRLKELLAFVQETDLQEVRWEKKGTLISFQRASSEAPVALKGTPLPAAPVSVEPAKPAAPAVIRSTMVGTFYRSGSPDRPPFVLDGTIVKEGQPLGAIEAMKIMKDVLAPSACRIVKALVTNGHAVEYGQALFEIEPPPAGEGR